MFGIPYLQFAPKEFLVASRQVTDDELLAIATKGVLDAADITFRENPREWTNFDAFVGLHIANARFEYQLSMEQYDKLVGLVCTHLDNLKKRAA